MNAPPREGSPSWLPAALALGATASLLALLALTSETLGSGDSFLHYLISRQAWSRPELFLDVWGRPVFTVVYAVPALLGLQAVRLWSVAISLVTCYATYRMAVAERSKLALMVIPLLVLQPEYLRASFDGLTELLFACLLALALWAFRRDRWLLSAALASLFSMARWEGILLILVWAFFLWSRRRLLSFLVFVPHLLWNLFTAIYYRDWPAVLFPLDLLFRDRSFTPKTYSWTDLLYYPVNGLDLLGPALLLLAQLGLIVAGRRHKRLLTALVAMVAFYVLAAWAMPGVRGAAVPMLRYFVCLAPLIVLYGLDGLNALLSVDRRSPWVASFLVLVLVEVAIVAVFSGHALRPRNLHLYLVGAGLAAAVWWLRRPATGGARWRLAGASLLIGAVLASTAAHAASHVRPFRVGSSEEILREAAMWLRHRATEGGVVLVSEPYLAYYASASGLPGTTLRYEWMNPQRARSLPEGEWIAWEWLQSSRMFFNVKRAHLDADVRYEFQRQFGPDRKAVRVYRRTPTDRPPPERFVALTGQYWPDETGSGMSKPVPADGG